jgi:acetyl esterase/lipase
MQSFASRLMPFVIALRGSKRRYRSAEATLARVEELRQHPASSDPPKNLLTTVDIALETVAGWSVYTVTPRGTSPARRGLYLHGGSYVFEIQRQHWSLIADLAVRAGIRFTVPIFPIPPVETAGTIVPKVADLAATLIADAGAQNVSLVGDSAGGGMVLAVAMLLRDRGLPAPRATVLISPWLDISGTDPELAIIEPRDPWLAVPGSHAAGALYRGDVAEDDPLVSPITGDLEGLGPLTMFSGTRDILNADAHRLVEKAAAAGHPLDYHEVPGMIHVYPLLPIPEARTARTTIIEAIGA